MTNNLSFNICVQGISSQVALKERSLCRKFCLKIKYEKMYETFNDCYWYLKNLISSIQEFQEKELVVEDILRWFVIISVLYRYRRGSIMASLTQG